MLLADKLIKWETGVGTEKGATLPRLLTCFRWDLHQRKMTWLVELGHERRGRGGQEGGRDEGEGRQEQKARGAARERKCRKSEWK